MKRTPAQEIRLIKNKLDEWNETAFTKPSKLSGKEREEAIRNYHRRVFEYISTDFWKDSAYHDENERARGLKRILQKRFTIAWKQDDYRMCIEVLEKMLEELEAEATAPRDYKSKKRKLKLHIQAQELAKEEAEYN
jgi:hypothetical protein